MQLIVSQGQHDVEHGWAQGQILVRSWQLVGQADPPWWLGPHLITDVDISTLDTIVGIDRLRNIGAMEGGLKPSGGPTAIPFRRNPRSQTRRNEFIPSRIIYTDEQIS